MSQIDFERSEKKLQAALDSDFNNQDSSPRTTSKKKSSSIMSSSNLDFPDNEKHFSTTSSDKDLKSSVTKKSSTSSQSSQRSNRQEREVPSRSERNVSKKQSLDLLANLHQPSARRQTEDRDKDIVDAPQIEFIKSRDRQEEMIPKGSKIRNDDRILQEDHAKGEKPKLSSRPTNRDLNEISKKETKIFEEGPKIESKELLGFYGDQEDDEEYQKMLEEIHQWKRKRVRALNEWKSSRRDMLRDWKEFKSKTFMDKLQSLWKIELKRHNDSLDGERDRLKREWESMKSDFIAFDETRVKAKQEELFVRWTQDRIKIMKDWEGQKIDALKIWNYMREERTRCMEEHWKIFKKNIMMDFEKSLEKALKEWEKEKILRENAEKERYEAMEEKRKEEWEEAKTKAISDWELSKREVLEENGRDKADKLEREAMTDWNKLKQTIVKSWKEEIGQVFKKFDDKKDAAIETFKKDFPDTLSLEKEYRKQQRGNQQYSSKNVDDYDILKEAYPPRSDFGVNNGNSRPGRENQYKDILPKSMLRPNEVVSEKRMMTARIDLPEHTKQIASDKSTFSNSDTSDWADSEAKIDNVFDNKIRSKKDQSNLEEKVYDKRIAEPSFNSSQINKKTIKYEIEKKYIDDEFSPTESP
ncbi:unnamed protein product [Gordionus sp. m RMFG-2023]|uniref:uncharacterized protein LOC135924206 n=1 Tax=Gordionus sp. m RMFG-2023 TaxID=3053472 RepID=UPI0030DFCA35